MSQKASKQYLRAFNILVGKQTTGTGITANEDFKIEFEITKTLRHTPNHAEIKIYNLSPDTEATIRTEFDELLVNGGYRDSVRTVFIGNIARVRRYRKGNDWITQIIAGDGDGDYYGTVINTTLAAGVLDSDVLNHIVSQFKKTKLGHSLAVTANKTKRLRGKVMVGPARNYLHQLAASVDTEWSIQDGVLQFVPFEGTLPGEATVINANTGMSKAPEINDKGIKVWCKLNPALKPGGRIKLDNNDIKEEMRTIFEQAAGAKKPGVHKDKKKRSPARIDPDGIYKILTVTHEGDTRGPKWQSELLCKALDKTDT